MSARYLGMTESGKEYRVPRYEYRIEHLVVNAAAGYVEFCELLKGFAAEGWRLVAVSDGLHYFEREL